MVKWAKFFGYNIQIDQWERMWLKGLKFSLSYNLKENFLEMMYHWYMTQKNCLRCIKTLLITVENIKNMMGILLCMVEWVCEKTEQYWTWINTFGNGESFKKLTFGWHGAFLIKTDGQSSRKKLMDDWFYIW